MTEELEGKIEVLEERVESLTQKVNEVISCLEDNNLSRKVSVEYIYPEEMAEDETPTEETKEEEKPEEEEKPSK